MLHRDIGVALCGVSWREMTALAFVLRAFESDTSFARLLRMRAFTRRAMAAMALLACVGCGGTVEVRFENASQQTFDLLQVDFGRAAEFEGLRPGEVTEYQEFDDAYSFGFVRAVIGTQKHIIQPIDFVGEEQLDPGKYTHVLRLDGPAPDGLSGVTRADD
jgi:hypothetical protein